jgi:hypothetical protein
MTLEPQISPNDEICSRCRDLGLPGVIPAGEEYMRLSNGAVEHNGCLDCWERLRVECEGEI